MGENKKNGSDQANRLNELLSKYASFVHMPMENKTRVIRLCGILVYLEAANSKNMTLKECIKSIADFLEKLRSPYIADDEKEGNVIIE